MFSVMSGTPVAFRWAAQSAAPSSGSRSTRSKPSPRSAATVLVSAAAGVLRARRGTGRAYKGVSPCESC
eukprot:3018365-Prymnesium_polylepis.1